MYEHTFFDMSILDSSSLVQADSQATYFLARQCKNISPVYISLLASRSQNKYQFVKANHTTQLSEIVSVEWEKLFLEIAILSHN
jgi:hypothetical protein